MKKQRKRNTKWKTSGSGVEVPGYSATGSPRRGFGMSLPWHSDLLQLDPKKRQAQEGLPRRGCRGGRGGRGGRRGYGVGGRGWKLTRGEGRGRGGEEEKNEEEGWG